MPTDSPTEVILPENQSGIYEVFFYVISDTVFILFSHSNDPDFQGRGGTEEICRDGHSQRKIRPRIQTKIAKNNPPSNRP